MPFSGRKPLIVCNGQVYEADDLADAKDKASELAGQTKVRAYVLIPKTVFKPGTDVKEEEIKDKKE